MNRQREQLLPTKRVPEVLTEEQRRNVNKLGPACKLTLASEKPFRMILTGKSQMGKTTLGVDLICTYIMKRVVRCFAVCPTFWQQPALARLRSIEGAFTEKNVFTEVNDDVFEHIFNQLDRYPAPTLLFVDDAAAEAATNKGNKGAFSRLCLASPHLQLWIVGCFQRLSSASPAFRDNTEALISFLPSKVQDVDTIQNEFNPSPANKKAIDIVKEGLTTAWDNSRFAFIWRTNFTGAIDYYAGFDKRVRFNFNKNLKP